MCCCIILCCQATFMHCNLFVIWFVLCCFIMLGNRPSNCMWHIERHGASARSQCHSWWSEPSQCASQANGRFYRQVQSCAWIVWVKANAFMAWDAVVRYDYYPCMILHQANKDWHFLSLLLSSIVVALYVTPEISALSTSCLFRMTAKVMPKFLSSLGLLIVGRVGSKCLLNLEYFCYIDKSCFATLQIRTYIFIDPYRCCCFNVLML